MSVRKTAKRLTDAVLVIGMLILFFLSFPQVIGLDCYAVVSGSMEPELPVGSLIYVKEKAPASIEIGEIITFRLEYAQEYVTHRVAKKNSSAQYFFTKGDRNQEVDPVPVKWDAVCGVKVCCIPYGGYVLQFLNNWKGKCAVLSSFLALHFIKEVLENEPKEKKEGKMR